MEFWVLHNDELCYLYMELRNVAVKSRRQRWAKKAARVKNDHL
jgi:hypothetical protein